MASTSPAHPRRILCPNFNDDEVKALRSLCELLQKYLKHPWQVVSHGEADLMLVNLDVAWTSQPHPPIPVVGCALRPRTHPPGTIHRPLRAAELLAVLSEFGSASRPPPAGRMTGTSETVRIAERYVLHGWPADFERWPPSWRRVLAALSRASASTEELVQCTGLSTVDVGRCIVMLDRQGLVERQHVAAAPASRTTRRWQGLAERVGQLLGFAR